MKLPLQQQADLGILGIKSARPAKIYTEQEDKARRKQTYAEQSLVTAYCSWFKLQYPGVTYQINSKEQRRSYVAQNVLKKQEFAKGIPDFECKRIVNGIRFELEFKKDKPTLFVNDLLRPGSNGHYYQQDDYHALLAKELIWCTFVWDLDMAMDLTNRFFSGKLPKRPVYSRSKPDYCYSRIL